VLSPKEKELALTNGSQPANGSGPVSTTKPVEQPEDGPAES
jgi:cell division protease FtsH